MKKPMNRFHRSARSGFTLIEMMVVITIIVLLGGLTVAGMGFVNMRKANAKAQVDIALLSKAIEEYKIDNGEYPGDDEDSPADGNISEQLYEALFLEGYQDQVAEVVDARRIYLPELDPRNSKQGWVTVTNAATVPATLQKILDPWKRPYRYRKGADAQNPDFDLWSTGKDGKSDETDPNMNIKENRDDIRNF